jgi:hypothetical protein
MAVEKIEFEFPDGEDGDVIEIEESSGTEMGEETKVDKDEVEVEEVGDEVEIEEVDDTPAADRNRTKSAEPEELTDEELGQYSDKVRKRIKHFSKGYHDERRAKEKSDRERSELENVARRLVSENNELKSTVGRNNTSLLGQAKQTVATELAEAKREYAAAYDAGNGAGLLEAQEKLTNSQLKVDKLNQIKLPTLQEQDDGVQQRQEVPKRPVANPKATEWAEDNTWFGDDDEMTSFALGFHNKLVKQGVDTNSEEYYEKVNSRMRQVFPDNFEDTDEVKPKAKRKSSNVVASATRTTAPKRVKLTKTQVSIANRLGVPLKDYAREVANDMMRKD